MTLTRLALCLSALTSPLVAQGAPLPIQDLVGTQGQITRPTTAEFVQRTFHNSAALMSGGGDQLPFHHLGGSGMLTPWGERAGFGDDSEPSGLLSPDDLAAAVAALSGSRESDLAAMRSGNSWRLHSEYPEQAAAALTELRAMLPSPVRLGVTLSRITSDGTDLLVDSSRTLRGARAAVFGDVSQHAGVADFDVEIAQSAATANPVTLEYNRGATVAVRARHLPFRDDAILETVVRVSRSLESEPMRVHRDFGELDRMTARVDEAAFTLRVAPGSTTVQEWSTVDGDTLRLTLSAAWRAGKATGQGRPLVLASNLIGQPILGFRYNTFGDAEEIRDGLFFTDMLRTLGIDDAATRMVTGNSGGGGMLILPPGREADVARRSAERQIDSMLTPVTVELEAFDAPLGTQLGSGELPADVRRLGRITGSGLTDLPMSFGSGIERAYLRDHDVEVAQAARIPDPKVGMIETGWFASLTVLSDPAGGRPRLEVSLDASRLIELERRELSINVAQLPQTETTPTPVMPQDLVIVELPEIAECRVRAELELDENGAGVFHSASRELLGPGRQLILRAALR